MIRDSDGKNPKTLVNQLCNYYGQRAYEDENIMRIKPENVLVLKYYSFENYFLEPSVMAKIGVVKTEEEFYNILYKKFKTYLYKLPSDYNIPNIMMTTYFVHYKEKVAFKKITFKPRQAGINSVNIPKIMKIGWKALGDFRKLKADMK